MNGFVVTTNQPDSEQEAVVTNDGWFPDVEPIAVRNACRLDGSVTPERLLPALKSAMLEVNAQLQSWADEQRMRWGYESLSDVPAANIGGQSAKLLQYQRAVHATLQAELIQNYRGTSTVATGNKFEREHEDLQCTAGDHLRQARYAVADICGQARCTVELI